VPVASAPRHRAHSNARQSRVFAPPRPTRPARTLRRAHRDDAETPICWVAQFLLPGTVDASRMSFLDAAP
jgi:hypothetical protein